MTIGGCQGEESANRGVYVGDSDGSLVDVSSGHGARGGDGMEDEVRTTDTLPEDWTKWRDVWQSWLQNHASDLRRGNYRFGAKNFLADGVLGVWKINGKIVELSEVTMPDFGARFGGGRIRYIGVTFAPHTPGEPVIVATLAELEELLGIPTRKEGV